MPGAEARGPQTPARTPPAAPWRGTCERYSSRFKNNCFTEMRSGSVSKGHRLFYHPTLGSRVIKEKKRSMGGADTPLRIYSRPSGATSLSGYTPLGFRIQGVGVGEAPLHARGCVEERRGWTQANLLIRDLTFFKMFLRAQGLQFGLRIEGLGIGVWCLRVWVWV